MDAPATSSTTADNYQPPSAYGRYADVFSRIYADAHSIAIALEVPDTYRARGACALPRKTSRNARSPSRPRCSTFPRIGWSNVIAADVTSARYIAAWVLRRRRWSYAKSADLFGLDHSTIIRGLRKVARTSHLLFVALKIEQLVDDAANARR